MSSSQEDVACLASLASQGFIVLPKAVPLGMIEHARALADDALRLSGGCPTSQQDAARWVAAKRNLKRNDIMLNLVNSSGILERLRGIVGPLQKCKNSQLAYRFPGERACTDDACGSGIAPNWDEDWHIDGFTKSDHSQSFETAYDFTVLLGIYLSDNVNKFGGNFTVFPGAHLSMQEYFCTCGPSELMHSGFAHPQKVLSLKNSLQIQARAGDVIVAHSSLPHTTAPNVTQDTRRVVFFRMVSAQRGKSKNHGDLLYRLLNIWSEWPLLQQESNTHHQKLGSECSEGYNDESRSKNKNGLPKARRWARTVSGSTENHLRESKSTPGHSMEASYGNSTAH